MPPGIKPLPYLKLTQFYVNIWHHQATMSWCCGTWNHDGLPRFRSVMAQCCQHQDSCSPQIVQADIKSLRHMSDLACDIITKWGRMPGDACPDSNVPWAIMGPISGADRTQMGPCWPHELCYLGVFWQSSLWYLILSSCFLTWLSFI